MIDFSGVIAGVFLLLLLMALATKGWMSSRYSQERTLGPGEGQEEACPKEFVSRLFSGDDWKFVHRQGPGIQRLFECERKQVALIWVREISAMVRNAVSEHAEAARHSKNLKFSSEVGILAQFFILMMSCGILSIAIQTAGPARLSGLAQFAQRLSQRAAQLQASFHPRVLTNATGSGVI